MPEFATPQEPQEPNDEIWQQFNADTAERLEREEVAYQEVEDYNRHLLNQIVGLEDAHFTSLDGQAPDLTLKPSTSRLFLRPDRQMELHNQGENSRNGDPYVITGDIPPRSQKLLDDMLQGINAKVDESKSEPDKTVYRGEIGGQPLEVVIHRQVYKLITENEEKLATRTFAMAHAASVNPTPAAEVSEPGPENEHPPNKIISSSDVPKAEGRPHTLESATPEQIAEVNESLLKRLTDSKDAGFTTLILQPDQRRQLAASGKDQDLGDPHTITGELNEESQVVLNRVLERIGVQADDGQAREGAITYSGMFDGQPVELKLQRTHWELTTPSGKTVNKVRTKLIAYNISTEKNTSDSESTNKSRRRIFPKRRKF